MSEPPPDFEEKARQVMQQANFINDLGITLVDLGPGWCETQLQIAPKHWQHHGLIHAGVSATMADHTAGAAASTVAPAGQAVLTVEFKHHLLRPGVGEMLRCRATVLKPGRMLCVVEAEVFARHQGKESLITKTMATMAMVPEPKPPDAR